jgi:hypothetical protein
VNNFHNFWGIEEMPEITKAEEKSMLFLMPLVQMAWAHGAISPHEKQIIFEAAREDAIDERHFLNNELDKKLTYQPSRNFFNECLLLIAEEFKEMTVKERAEKRSTILTRCQHVAASAGGKSLMDIEHHVSIEEKQLLDELNEILR